MCAIGMARFFTKYKWGHIKVLLPKLYLGPPLTWLLVKCVPQKDDLYQLTICSLHYNNYSDPPCLFSPALTTLCLPWHPSSLKEACCCLANDVVPSQYWSWPCLGAVLWIPLSLHIQASEQYQAELERKEMSSPPSSEPNLSPRT